MNKCVSRGLWGVLFVGGLSLLGVGTAHADEATTSGDGSLLGGNQAIVEIDAPITVNGNAVSVVGDAESEDATTKVESSDGGDDRKIETSGDDSVGGGNQAVVDVEAPVTVNGNAVTVVGDSSSEDATTIVKSSEGDNGHDGKHKDRDNADVIRTSGDDSVLGGNQVITDIVAPVAVNGNAVTVVGDAESDDATTIVSNGGGDNGKHGEHDKGKHEKGKHGEHDKGKHGEQKCYGDGDRYITSGDDSVLGGNQVITDVFAPVTFNGNAVTVVGDAESDDATTIIRNSDGCDGGTVARTSGDDSVLGGNQVITDIVAPLTVNGNAVTVVGDAESEDAKTVLLF